MGPSVGGIVGRDVGMIVGTELVGLDDGNPDGASVGVSEGSPEGRVPKSATADDNYLKSSHGQGRAGAHKPRGGRVSLAR